MENKAQFQLSKILKELKHYLPEQAPLKDFIHHNTLHSFQGYSFFEGTQRANEIFGYRVSLSLLEYRELFKQHLIHEDAINQVVAVRYGESLMYEWKFKMVQTEYDVAKEPRVGKLRNDWKSKLGLNIDSLTHPVLFRILCSFLDQGVSIWKFPNAEHNFIDTLRQLEHENYGSLFKGKLAPEFLKNKNLSVEMLLNRIAGNEHYFEAYLFDQQFAHPGWSGIVSAIEHNAQTLLDTRKITLEQLIILELLIEIDTLESKFGSGFKTLNELEIPIGFDLWRDVEVTEYDKVMQLWQLAYEFTYYDEVLKGIAQNMSVVPKQQNKTDRTFQAMFCIDDRECSIRRHVEQLDPKSETFGTPGFFGVEFFYQPKDGQHYTKHCPAPVTPKYLIKEFGEVAKKSTDIHFHRHSHSMFIGWILTHTYGFWSALKLILSVFKPKMGAAVATSLKHMDVLAELTVEHHGEFENGLQIGYTLLEMTDRLEALLRSVGLLKDFAPMVYFVGHGSSSVNNPHFAAYDCGACSGRPGSVNARVMADIANRVEVRKMLAERGISIPDATRFIGGLQDTTRDEFVFYDEQKLDATMLSLHENHLKTFESASKANALERSRRFELIDSKDSIDKVYENVQLRSVSLFEPRPELNHATNTLCIVGRRDLTRNVFLDRRAFLNSYDYQTDKDGKYLYGILKAVAPVCGGINLEYYFSRVDNSMLGAGSKLPHNVMGLIGVANGIDGDLRTGLPSQMIEVHDPLRLLVVVEHFPDVVLNTIQTDEHTFEWFKNEWIHLVVIHPDNQQFLLFHQGEFVPYSPKYRLVEIAKDFPQIFRRNHENLPVYLMN